jgi:hypothetical protein
MWSLSRSSDRKGIHMQANREPHTRLGCSTISFRHLALDEALAQIAELGFPEIDLGALPGHPISNLI